jgi:hypothetical protein
VDYIESNAQAHSIDGIAYIYFNYKQQESQTARHIYASLVAQLLKQIPALQDVVEPLYNKHNDRKRRASAEELFSILSNLPSSGRVLLAFDALDEASRDTMKALVSQLAKLETKSLLVFLTSRPNINLNSIGLKTQIKDVAAQTSDLEVFIQAHLIDHVMDTPYENHQAIIEEIIRNVVSHAAGMCVI